LDIFNKGEGKWILWEKDDERHCGAQFFTKKKKLPPFLSDPPKKRMNEKSGNKHKRA